MSTEDMKVGAAGSLDGDESTAAAAAATVKLTSKDGREFHIEKKFANCSNLIKTSLEQGQRQTRQRERRKGRGEIAASGPFCFNTG